MRDPALDILFEPLKMPNLVLKNRLFMAPVGTTFTSEQLTEYLAARARGEVACITTGVLRVHPGGTALGGGDAALETDADILKLSPMVRAVQKEGAKIIAQLNHAGRYSFARLTGRQSVAPSPIASRYTGETPRELSTQEADDLVRAFAESGLRARKAGFDGIEICANSGYLISQFLSAVTNQRNDRYGGDNVIERADFLFSVLGETRKLVGEDFNICVKLDAEDGVKGGKTLEDSLLLAPKIVEAGADRLHVWAGWHEAQRPMLPMSVPRGAFTYLAKAVKNVVDVPVATVGRINDPFLAADILRKGEADLVGLARQLLCDPDFVKKTKEGRVREIRRCSACCYCFDQLMMGMQGGQAKLKCCYNPELGREGEHLVAPASRKKRVVVVGGGPAGMEAARVAALRGHDVVLFEKEGSLGGMLNLAVLPPHKEEIGCITDFYKAQMEILSVEVRLGETFTAEKARELKPDAVILATGAEPLLPAIPGIGKENVITALDVLRGQAVKGKNIVVIGGGMIGCETAEYLAEQGDKQVTVVEMLDRVASDVGPTSRWVLLSRLKQKVSVRSMTKVVEIRENGVVVEDRDGNISEIMADTVVVAAGLKARKDSGDEFTGLAAQYFEIGSCCTPGQIVDAVHPAFEVGCSL
jgi:2,4-dienoyl-CoA reductase-like NADH-dependent reductase (Old Yellow Enzyme family)/thioredoxin reductase